MSLHWVSLFIAISATSLGQFFYKLFFQKKNTLFVILAVSLFISVPLFSYYALQEIDINIVYMSTAVTHILVIFLSKMFLNEQIQLEKMYAVLVVFFGMIVYFFL